MGCAAFYIAAAIDAGDVLALIGGVLFLLACLVFLFPLVRRRDGQ